MELLAARQETAINAQLAGVLPGDPPKMNLVIHATGRNGTKRRLTRQVSILDHSLFARLKQEASTGDYLHATVVSEYRETGSVTYLTDFNLTDPKQAPDVETVVSVPKNGTVGSVSNSGRDDIRQITLPSARDPETKVKY